MLAGLLQAFEGRHISGITTRIEQETDALDLSLPTHEKNSASNLLAPTLNARRNTARFWNSWQDLAWNPAASLGPSTPELAQSDNRSPVAKHCLLC